MSRTILYYFFVVNILVALAGLGCTRALPTRDEQAGIRQALVKAETQARIAKQYANESVKNRQEAARYLEQAKALLNSALRMQELCKKRAQTPKCNSPKQPELENVSKVEAKPKDEPVSQHKVERQAESAVSQKKEKPVEPNLNLNDLDYAPSDAPPGIYEKLNRAPK